MKKIKLFLNRKDIEISVNRYLITTLSYMTYGLFASLIIGSILNQIGLKLNIPFLSETIWPMAKKMTGAAIAVGVSYGLKSPPLVIFSSIIPGAIGGSLGGPVGALVATIFSSEFGKIVSKETKIDILVTPITTIIIGSLTAIFIGPYINNFMLTLGDMVTSATLLHPIIMSIIVATIMGMSLTLPISSAALGIMLGLSGLAAGAATVGCSAQMIGFAVISFNVNGFSGLFSQGIGTSMLQMPNIIKNWKIWIPPTLSGAILAPFATTLFHLENTAIGSGMGTSGFVGQFGTFEAMKNLGYSNLHISLIIVLMHLLLPAILSLIFARILIHLKWIKTSDFQL